MSKKGIFRTNENGNLEYEFTSSISIDNGYSNNYKGEYTSSMELFKNDKGTPTVIEWCVDELDEVEHIGLSFDGKSLDDYDGVFDLPKQAIQLIQKAGYTVGKEFTEDVLILG